MTMIIPEAVSGLFTDRGDTRPSVSPYATPSVALQLKDASRLYVPAHLLWKSHKLSSLDKEGVCHLDISHDVAHVLVHYLFTDTYQCLRPKGTALDGQHIAEFLTSIRVYITARDYKLPLLEELARAEISRLGNGFHIPLVFDLVQEAYPNPNLDDTWLCQYLKSRLSILFTDPNELLEWDPTPEQKVTTISDILLKNILELLRENIKSSYKLANGIHGKSQADPPKGDVVPSQDIETLGSDEAVAIELNTDNNTAMNAIEVRTSDENTDKHSTDTEKTGIDTEKNSVNKSINTIKHDVSIEKNDINTVKSESEISKTDSNTNKIDGEFTRNGVHTAVSKSESCEPEISKGGHLVNGLDYGVNVTENKKDEKDFWGLSLKKKKKKKSAKGLVPEPLQEGVTVKI